MHNVWKSFQASGSLVSLPKFIQKLFKHKMKSKEKKLLYRNGHMLTHRNKKPYECKAEGCGKSYCDARSLRRHTENHHTGSNANSTGGNREVTSPLASSCIQYAPPTAYQPPPYSASSSPASSTTNTPTKAPSHLQQLLASDSTTSTTSSASSTKVVISFLSSLYIFCINIFLSLPCSKNYILLSEVINLKQDHKLWAILIFINILYYRVSRYSLFSSKSNYFFVYLKKMFLI